MSPDPCPTCAVEPRISHFEIRERAYDLWDRHHRPDGYELEFWFMAERELKAERRSTPSSLPEAERT
ncbi:DUF2934 domain-containing protein [Methylobacterium radiotolerans]|uniref:DUF2934 domain-containing protein n=1 Tax=Methylobacterium radiotolerans TaxID=31998 RepID=UPI001F35D301|nr:DUF2934 domain-containing protein [Methylobacterium radiotolerans]UIY45785.1 DUF2934 domain-containing protein [Methylobacterium radiotolerans]